jgi:hypothetical protein
MPPERPYKDVEWREPDDPPTIPPGATATLLGLVIVHAMNGRATVREVAMITGKPTSISTVHAHLVQLRRAGLVAWEDNLGGTLRPLVDIVDGPWTTRMTG